MNPSKQELLERERRSLRPAGFITLFAVLLFAAGVVVQQAGLDRVDTDAERLTQFHEHGNQLLIGQILQGLAIGLFAVPLYVLFKAAEARAERVRGALVGFCLIGPVLFTISTIVFSLGVRDAANDFVEKVPAVEREAREKAEAEQAGAAQPAPEAKQEKNSEPAATETTATETTATEATETSTTEAASDEEPQTPDEAVEDARENLAEDVIDDSGLARTAASLQIPAVLSMLVALIYTSLWSVRTGLLTRFWGSFGMALGIALILLGSFGLFLTVLWFAVLGIRFAGFAPGGMPPAWAAGEAIPWEPPGQQGAPDDRDVEGSGREIAEPRLPEEGETDSPGDEPPEPGPPPKKRKRRD